MKIDQMLPNFAYGDAIGNDVIAISSALKERNFESAIFADEIDERLKNDSTHYVDEYKEGDILLYHASTGCPLNSKYKNWKSRKWIIYHNVTSPEFFERDDPNSADRCRNGLEEIKAMKDDTELCIADSEFNKKGLEEMGYTCPIEVLPILIAFDDYKKEPNQELINKYKNDDYVNILFTGRIAPNKKYEDLIGAFYYYKKYINKKSRLILAGSYVEESNYYKKLNDYIAEIGVDDVMFTGHIPFQDLLAYYHIADVFLCMSEHEGFCVPLVEAMYFNLPIIAYKSTAIPETLGGSGLLLNSKDGKLVAEAIDLVMKDEKLRETIIENGKERLKYFSNDNIKEKLYEIIDKYI